LSRHDDHRYVIVGAGAIGGTVGGVLARARIRTLLIARGPNAEVLAAAGITLRTPDGTFRTEVSAASRAEDVRLTDRDVLVFATKTHQLDAALQEWVDQPVHGPHGVIGTAGERLPAMTALNGVAAEEKALRYFRRVFGVCVWLPAVHLEPGEVIVRSWPVVGQFHIARWPASVSTQADA
jgi:2-dehydropantoate 2-reductase